MSVANNQGASGSRNLYPSYAYVGNTCDLYDQYTRRNIVHTGKMAATLETLGDLRTCRTGICMVRAITIKLVEERLKSPCSPWHPAPVAVCS